MSTHNICILAEIRKKYLPDTTLSGAMLKAPYSSKIDILLSKRGLIN